MMDIEATYVPYDLCGEDRSFDIGNEHWVIVCTQCPNHEGPHVGMISWGESAEAKETP